MSETRQPVTRQAVTRPNGERMAPIANPRRIPFTAEYSLQDFARIRLGFRPQAMEDKWFVFCEEKVLYLHRSWTGHCIYRVAFEERSGTVRVSTAEVNRDPEQYNQSDDAYDAKLLAFLIDSLLLQRPAKFPQPAPIAGSKDADLYRHVVAGRRSKARKAWWKFW